ncbi:MAG: hypothetical protein HUU46_08130 [Candidatus Hydrogenedentes bacterium]|nr:hypothetical protein [Candidatus Hydrogenedentota bacterium]
MAACPVCGVALPGNARQCPTCNADLANASALMNDILGAPPPPRAAPQQKPVEKKPIPYGKVIVTALLWGWACAAALGLALGAVMQFFVGGGPGSASFIAGLNSGGMLGFLIGSVYGAVTVLNLEMGKAAIVGLFIGAADTTIHYFGESILLAEPDFAAYLYTLMGCGAGAAAGALSVVLRNYREGG